MDAAVPTTEPVAGSATKPRGLAAAGLAALGIVYGDLGTSPLYTYQTIVTSVGGHPSAGEALGLLSLVVWALIITVSIKYCLLVMRADNRGEGGILVLMSLVSTPTRSAGALVFMGLFGAALLYGDGCITPAISVLSALEGINVTTDAFKPYVLPAALAVLLALFAAQSFGTAKIARVFGPVMLAWFATIAVLGLASLVRRPGVLVAIDPSHAIRFLATHGWHSFVVLGAVFLAITGGEALYADMGGLGRGPIRISWYGIVLPALLLSYAGQTALLIQTPSLDGNPFFKLAPGWAVIPLVALATAATIIASQAIITGVFTLTRQAMQLNWFPGLNIRQTSADEYGQIYVPFLNWAMMLGTLALAYGFGSSDKLAGAYGTAVSTTMLLTTALLFNAMRDVWHWPAVVAAGVSGVFLVVDVAFFAANLLKIGQGGWVPLVLGGLIFTLMLTWRAGIEAVRRKLAEIEETPEKFLADLRAGRIPRVHGTGVFLTRGAEGVPPLMVRHVTQMGALPEVAVSLAVRFEEVPRVPLPEQSTVEQLTDGLWRVTARFGFIDVPNLPAALAQAKDKGCPLDLDGAIYFASRDAVSRSEAQPRLMAWQRIVFGFMYRNAVHAADRFDLPAERFIEVGRQVRL